ncbi:MAG: hypothetical protein K5907_07830 [Treponema sp.]|nr:hypothetical protein [Treponema sp.]
MKKGFLVVLLIALISPVFSQIIPKELDGIWEGKDRFVFFENAADDENPELVIILKTYYGWYYDRAAEPLDYKEKEARTPNAATHKEPELIPYTITKSNNSNAYQINLNYSKHNQNITSFAIIDNKIYLNPYIKIELQDEETRADYTLWRSFQESLGFLMYEQATDQNISLLILKDNKYYDVRYWLTDMDYDSSFVLFKYKNEEYSVPKHLFADGTNYSCVNGRSKKVRNTMPAFELDKANAIFNSENNVLILNQEPYLTKLTDKTTFENLMQIIKEANSRRKPDPEPIFPVKLPAIPSNQ